MSFFVCVSISSLLCGIAPPGAGGTLGHENEMQSAPIHSTKLVVLFYNKSTAKWTVIYTVLDAVLWPGVLVLAIL